jgi:hypothetical protein
MQEGQTLRVESVTGKTITIQSGARYGLGAVLRGHEQHSGPRVGDILVVATNSTPGGDTLVTLPCGCSALLTVSPD